MSMRKTQWALLLASGLVLAGCGGGSDDDLSNGAPLPTGSDSNVYSVTSTGRLLGYDAVNPSRQANTNMITGIPAGQTVIGAAFRPNGGKLYVVTNAAGVGNLYTVDTTSAVATLIGTLAADSADTTAAYTGLTGTTFGVSFNAVPDRLRIVSDSGQNLRIVADTGLVTTDTALSGADTKANGVAYSNNFNSACRTTIYYVDTTAAMPSLLTSTAPNGGVTTAIGSLGITPSATGGLITQSLFTGSGATPNNLYGVFTVGTVTGLYTINTTTGAATLSNKLPLVGTETVLATATVPSPGFPVQPVGDLVGLSSNGRLVSFNVAAPAKLCTNASAAALGLVGIDRRPKTGALYGVSADGNLYTVSTTSGAGTLVCPLVDTTGTAFSFSGTNYAVNWNPVADKLRVVGADTQENFRIDPTPGPASDAVPTGSCTITADTNVNSVGIVAASYTNSTIGTAAAPATAPASTTLYGINTTTSTLVTIGANPATTGACPTDTGNPNCGQVTTVGALSGLPAGGTLQLNGGFEIAYPGTTGTATNTAYAALAVDTATAPATGSTLYTIDTSSGAVTAVGAIGTSRGGSASFGFITGLTTK